MTSVVPEGMGWPIQADFILRRLAEMAQADPQLRGRQPWKAAYDRDHGWLGTVLAEHYAGNDANVGTLMAGVLAAFDGISVEDFEAKSDAFLRTAKHPTLGRQYLECAYVPMVELLGYLEANGFTNYIASGGGRDFMRPISQEVYGIPRDQVIGSATTFRYTPNDPGAHRLPGPRCRRSRCRQAARTATRWTTPRATASTSANHRSQRGRSLTDP